MKAMDRFRKLAGYLDANPGSKANTDEILTYIQQEGDGGDPATTISLDKPIVLE